ncbi:MAG: disulfide bond formation protein DsbA [Betaproteobacteria bacterium]|nr:disulfide bond formation protein DsbA [Betaproteobacteria bacterium]
MNPNIPARWYFDIVSPFAYLHLKRLGELHPALAPEFVPVLFAGLPKHWENKGPAELAPKRLHTYRSCIWTASQLGIPFRLPPRHPFNPLHAQRLLVALGAPRAAVEAAYDFVWGEGRDLAAEWPLFCERVGISETHAATLIADPAVKQKLMDNTAQAAAQGVFGVPTLEFRGQCFWGSDAIAWANAYVDQPQMFESGEMRRAAEIEIGAARKEAR